MSDTFNCGHARSERNSYEWVDGDGRLRTRCRQCKRVNQRKSSNPEVDRARSRRRYARLRVVGCTLAPDDPRHGTTNAYNNLQCRCPECREAVRAAKRVRELKVRCRRLGIPIPRELQQVRGVVSLDAVADARFGMDRVLVGTEWDDPTGDIALERMQA